MLGATPVRAIVVAVTVLAQGCSLAFVSGPPSNHARLPAFECSTSKWAPVADSVVAGIQALNFAAAASSTDEKWHDAYCQPGDRTCSPPAARGTTMAISAAVALVFGASLYYGFTRVGDCKDAKSELALRATTPIAPAAPVVASPTIAPAPAAPAPAASATGSSVW
jgi:hypothetical protein